MRAAIKYGLGHLIQFSARNYVYLIQYQKKKKRKTKIE